MWPEGTHPGRRSSVMRPTRNILAAGGIPWHRRVSLNDRAGDSESEGEWVTVSGGRIRFMALRSDHAPHFQGIELYEGFYRSRRTALPVFAWDWVGGETLAYLIDFLDENGDVEFRIHYADATSSPPDGHVAPTFWPSTRSILLCFARRASRTRRTTRRASWPTCDLGSCCSATGRTSSAREPNPPRWSDCST